MDEEKSKIENLKEGLYSRRTDGIFEKERHQLTPDYNENKISESWQEEKEIPKKKIEIPYMKIFLGAVIFFVLALGFSFYKFFMGGNSVSGDNIDISISGPVSVSGGEILPLDILIKNNNSVDLVSADLKVEYPEGTKQENDSSKDLKRTSENLGGILKGEEKKYLVKAILFGEENSQKIIKVTVEYRIPGSNAIFDKTKEYSVIISSTPVNIKVDGPDEVSSNQNVNFKISVKSNSTNILKNLILKIDYPFGFNYTSSNPKSAVADGSLFELGDLEPGGQRVINVSGVIIGQDGEERFLRFSIGTRSADDSNTIGTTLSYTDKSIMIKKSFVGVGFYLNQNSDKEISIDPGSKIRGDINWQNNLNEKIFDMNVVVKLKGDYLDKTSVIVPEGYYNSSDNTIRYDKSSISNLSEVNPASSGQMNFNFNILPLSSGKISANSQIDMDITVFGKKSSSAGQNQETLYFGSKSIKVSSALKLLSRGYRSVGPFENSGPFPLKVDNESTFTITWTATNSFNNISNARVSAILPPNVSWKGITSPDSENISYDNSRGEILWNIGEVKAGTGNIYQAKEVSFQVSVTPSVSQVGKVLNILNEATISGIDNFSGARIGEVKIPVTTNITSDPIYIDGSGKVTE